MNITGHPFIDVGMGIAANLADVSSLDDLTSENLADAVAHFDAQMSDVQQLKVLAIYWTNNSFVNNPSQLPKYQAILRAVIGTPPAKKGSCQICGNSSVYIKVDRSWFPLGGSFLGDSATFPNLGGKMICADCFRALVSLPLGAQLCKGAVYAFHLLDPELQVQATARGVKAVQTAIAAGESGNAALKAKTKLSGRLELLEIAANSFLWGTDNQGILSHRAEGGATVFSFSNSGTGASYNELKLPAQALDFFGEIMRAEGNLTDLFISWAEGWVKFVKANSGVYDRICDDVEARSSLAPILGAVVRARKIPVFTGEEKQLLRIYEDVALEKRKRFDALEAIAERINAMETRYRDSLVKQLANTRSKERLLELLREFAHSEKTNLRLTKDEIRVVQEAPAGEAINLLYLLCVAEA